MSCCIHGETHGECRKCLEDEIARLAVQRDLCRESLAIAQRTGGEQAARAMKAEQERDKWRAAYDSLMRRVIRADMPEVGNE